MSDECTPPIEPQDYIGGVTVIDIGDAREAVARAMCRDQIIRMGAHKAESAIVAFVEQHWRGHLLAADAALSALATRREFERTIAHARGAAAERMRAAIIARTWKSALEPGSVDRLNGHREAAGAIAAAIDAGAQLK